MEGRVWAALDDTNPVDPVDPVDPAACAKLGFRLRETLLLPLETPWGVFLGEKKAPAGMGTPQHPGFKS